MAPGIASPWVNRRTVLVLGAGASHPYGFPLGRELKGTAGDPEAMTPDLLDCLEPRCELDRFAADLRDSPMKSVDAFLERRPDYLNIGKVVIATLLLRHERQSLSVRNPNGDWLSYLLDKMLPPDPSDFLHNRLSVVTFNYDRSFEYRVVKGIQTTYGMRWTEALKVSRNIPVVHVYGSLGALDGDDAVDFGAELEPFLVLRAAHEIKIVHEQASNDTPELREARQRIGTAQRVASLRFGYHDQNVKRLRLEPGCNDVATHFHCLLVDITESEQKTLVEPLFREVHRWTHFERREDSLEFVRNNVDLFHQVAMR